MQQRYIIIGGLVVFVLVVAFWWFSQDHLPEGVSVLKERFDKSGKGSSPDIHFTINGVKLEDTSRRGTIRIDDSNGVALSTLIFDTASGTIDISVPTIRVTVPYPVKFKMTRGTSDYKLQLFNSGGKEIGGGIIPLKEGDKFKNFGGITTDNIGSLDVK